MASTQNNKSSTSPKSKRDKERQDGSAVGAGLNEKQIRFAQEFIIDRNATQAAKRAGYSEKTAYSQGQRLLKHAEIQTLIQKLRDESASRLELTRDDCIRQYQRLAFSDTRKLYDAYGQIKPIHELDDDTAAAVQAIEVVMQQIDGPDAPPVPVLKVKLADRKGSLDSIMKAQGWNLPDKVEHTGKGGGPIEHAVRVVLVPPKVHAQTTVRPLTKTDIGD